MKNKMKKFRRNELMNKMNKEWLNEKNEMKKVRWDYWMKEWIK